MRWARCAMRALDFSRDVCSAHAASGCARNGCCDPLVELCGRVHHACKQSAPAQRARHEGKCDDRQGDVCESGHELGAGSEPDDRRELALVPNTSTSSACWVPAPFGVRGTCPAAHCTAKTSSVASKLAARWKAVGGSSRSMPGEASGQRVARTRPIGDSDLGYARPQTPAPPLRRSPQRSGQPAPCNQSSHYDDRKSSGAGRPCAAGERRERRSERATERRPADHESRGQGDCVRHGIEHGLRDQRRGEPPVPRTRSLALDEGDLQELAGTNRDDRVHTDPSEVGTQECR